MSDKQYLSPRYLFVPFSSHRQAGRHKAKIEKPMPYHSIVFRTCFRTLDDTIKLYKIARHQNGTPTITDFAGIVSVANTQVWQENAHQREQNIVNHVVNSGLYTDQEIAEVIILGGHQIRMSKTLRRNLVNVVATLKPWTITPAITNFQSIVNYLDVSIRAVFAARRFKLNWFGPLLKYDMALRIAYAHYHATGSATLMPTDVYLYQGAKSGAKKLLGVKNTPDTMPAAAINSAFASCGLSAEEVEDFLCVMHPFLTVGGVLPGQVAQVVCDKYHWLINRRLENKIKRNLPIAQMDILNINNKV